MVLTESGEPSGSELAPPAWKVEHRKLRWASGQSEL